MIIVLAIFWLYFLDIFYWQISCSNIFAQIQSIFTGFIFPYQTFQMKILVVKYSR